MRILLVFSFLLCYILGNSQTVYITPTGEKYHTKSHYASGSPISLADAQKKGYEPCKVCKPLTKSSQPVYQDTKVSSETKQNTTATQCRGITKAGARCKRTTTDIAINIKIKNNSKCIDNC